MELVGAEPGSGRVGLGPGQRVWLPAVHSPLGHMLDVRPETLTIKAIRELSGDRPMGILLGSKIHLFYNCPPDVFIDPRIRWAGEGEVAQSSGPPPVSAQPRQENEGNHPF